MNGVNFENRKNENRKNSLLRKISFHLPSALFRKRNKIFSACGFYDPNKIFAFPFTVFQKSVKKTSLEVSMSEVKLLILKFWRWYL